MADSIFLQGKLEMSSSPVMVEEALPLWGEILSNRLLVALSVLLFIFALKDIFKLTPSLVYMLQQKHGSQSLEYNISIARIRNFTALICICPFCLIADKYALYDAAFMADVSPMWRSCVHIGIFAAFLLLRRIIHSVIKVRRMHSDELASFSHSPYNYFILTVFVMVASSLVMSFFNAGNDFAHSVTMIEIALFYFLSLIRSGQILRSYCGGLATILYLCGLEILPAAILIASAVVF